jgi:transposase
MTDKNGLLFAVIVTAASVHGSKVVLRLVDAIPPLRLGVGRPRKRPSRLKGDKGNGSEELRKEIRKRHIKSLLSKRRKPRKNGRLWPIERTHSWLNQYRRLKVRYDGFKPSIKPS